MQEETTMIDKEEWKTEFEKGVAITLLIVMAVSFIAGYIFGRM